MILLGYMIITLYTQFLGKGIYQYNASTLKKVSIIEGNEEYDNLRTQNNIIYYGNGKRAN